MFEIVASIIAGLMVKHWVAFFICPCVIGLIQSIRLDFRPRRRHLSSGQVAQMKHDGMTDGDIREVHEGLDLLNRMAPGRWIIYLANSHGLQLPRFHFA